MLTRNGPRYLLSVAYRPVDCGCRLLFFPEILEQEDRRDEDCQTARELQTAGETYATNQQITGEME